MSEESRKSRGLHKKTGAGDESLAGYVTSPKELRGISNEQQYSERGKKSNAARMAG
jgi:hypothetical protein